MLTRSLPGRGGCDHEDRGDCGDPYSTSAMLRTRYAYLASIIKPHYLDCQHYITFSSRS